MSDSSDNRLIKELYETHREMMLKIALGILHNRADAEDAVQDVFLRISRRKFADVLYVLQEFLTKKGAKFAERRALSVNVNTL